MQNGIVLLSETMLMSATLKKAVMNIFQLIKNLSEKTELIFLVSKEIQNTH